MQTLSRESVLRLYERLESLVKKLPGGLQKPILNELTPIREFFLDQRPARIVVLGGASEITAPALLHALCGTEVETRGSRSGWRTYQIPDRGAVEILDGRTDVPDDYFTTTLQATPPDAVILLRGLEDVAFEPVLDLARTRLRLCDEISDTRPGVVALAFGSDAEGSKERLSAILGSRREFAHREVSVFSEADDSAQVSEAVCRLLPTSAQLEFARLTRAKGAQVAIASTLLKSFTAVCGVIGVQPIPLADMPVLMTLQSLMVGLIVYVSGRRASPRLIAEFAGALGFNFGAGLAFREGARALLKVFPVWGNAISGIVAGAGTYAIGRAAIAYFIEDLPIQEAKKLFGRLQPGLESFRKKGLPFRRKRKKPRD